MATLRQAIQAKIDVASSEVSALALELATAEQTFTDWLDVEVDTLKSKADAFVATVGKYL